VPAVYLDHNATTPLDPRVRDAMLPWLGERWGNASSTHRFGQAAHAAVEAARAQVAALLGAEPAEVVFTASGTEANNAVVASALRDAESGDRVVASSFEHPSVRAAVDAAVGASGMEATWIPPQPDGVVSAQRFVAALGPDVRLAALMLANNELGTVQPVSEVAAAARAAGVPILCDAVQAAGKIPIRVSELDADYVVVGAHKFHGPLGAAALRVRPGASFEPLLVGGGQERRRRASTAKVPALVGFGRACELAAAELEERAATFRVLRDRLEAGVERLGGIMHGRSAPRLPHTTSVAFPGVVNQELMMRLDLAGFAISIGAACSSGAVEPSATLLALGLPHDVALGTIRISFGLGNTQADVDALLAALARELAALGAAPASSR